MYEEYLKKRMDSHGNGIITQISPSTPFNTPHSTTKVRFEIYNKEGGYEITFGNLQPLLVTETSRANAISSVVGYGWELIGMGATCVIVDILDYRFFCVPEHKLKPKIDYLQYVLGALSERINFDVPGAKKSVKIWAPDLPFDGIELQYLPPERQGSVNPYLGNLGKYLSAVFDKPIQLNHKSTENLAVVNNQVLPGYTTITHFEQLEGFVKYRNPTYKIAISKLGFVDLVESRRLRITGPSTAYYDISIADRTYRLHLWSVETPAPETLEKVRKVLVEMLRDFIVHVSVRYESSLT